MKSIAAAAFSIATIFMSVSPAPAQNHLVRASVPFSFTVGDQTLPSGNYTIGSRMFSPDVLTLTNWEKKVTIQSLGQPNQSNHGQANTLVFHKYGDQYFLSEIRSEGASMNIHFPVSKAEKRARTQVEEAGLFVNDPVLIALN